MADDLSIDLLVLTSAPTLVWEAAVAQERWFAASPETVVTSCLVPTRWYSLDKKKWVTDVEQ